MTSRTQQDWISRLDAQVAALAAAPTIESLRRSLMVVWRAAAAIGQPVTPAAELRWMRLAEALSAAWTDLATLDDRPEPTIPGADQPADDALDDTAQVRDATARLVRATAAALRGLSADDNLDVDSALTMSSIAVSLDQAVEDWP